MKIHKEDTEQARRRVEAWWNHAIIDRAVIRVTAPQEPSGDGASLPVTDDLERYFTDPDIVIPHAEAQLARTYHAGEAFPVAPGVPIGFVAILAAYLGSRVSFKSEKHAWSYPIIDDPANLPDLDFDPENEWWQKSKRLMEAFAERADGYHVCVPDLNGPSEILARLRGTQELALDFALNPDYIEPAVARITEAWHRCWQEATQITQKTGGYFYWMRIWSDRPSIDLQSDFSCMISPAMFNEHFLPSLEKQTHMVERTIYHLDGPDAIRHLDALLALPELDGIQWVPGAGAGKPVTAWIPLLRRIQDAGKLVYAQCPNPSVETMLTELKPEGLMLATSCKTREEADELLKNVMKWTGSRAAAKG